MADTVIRGGLLVTSEGVQAKSVVIEDGAVAAIVAHDETVEAGKIVDATGKMIMPGFVDAHVHLREPGFTHKEDFSSGTMAAAAGGVTTVMNMPTDDPWTASASDFEQKRDIMDGRIHVDVALQAAVGATHGHIEALAELGAISFEIFLAGGRPEFQIEHDSQFRDALRAVKAVNGVAGITAGDAHLIAALLDQIKASGQKDIAAFNAVRPPESEATGVERACAMAAETGAKIHFRQISSAESVAVLRRFVHLDIISAEVTPHNLLLTESDAERLGPFGAVIPPLRSDADCMALLAALRDGIIDIVATDHAPHLREEKEIGRDDIWKVTPGLPGVQTFAPVMMEMVTRDNLGWPELVRTCAETPARLFGLYPKKGAVSVGSDADVIIVDCDAVSEISHDAQLSRAGWTPFDGVKIHNVIERTMLRGRTIYLDGEMVPSPSGKFLRP